MTDTKRHQCRHILTNGHRCAAICLRNEHFCYYHHSTRRRQHVLSQTNTLQLPLPEDRSAIQTAIGLVLQRIAANDLDPRRAGLLLYGLQIASLNLPKEKSNPNRIDPEPVEEIVLHPELGPIAPAAELPSVAPENHPSNINSQELAAASVRLYIRQTVLDGKERKLIERSNQLDQREQELNHRESQQTNSIPQIQAVAEHLTDALACSPRLPPPALRKPTPNPSLAARDSLCSCTKLFPPVTRRNTKRRWGAICRFQKACVDG